MKLEKLQHIRLQPLHALFRAGDCKHIPGMTIAAPNPPFNSWWLPPNGALHGDLFDHQLALNLWIAAALLVLAHLILFVALLARKSAEKPKPRQPVNAWMVEVLPLAALSVLFAWLSITAEHLWAQQRYVGADASAMQVEVVGVQFQWYFRYPGPDAAFGHTRPALVDPGAGNPLGLDPADMHSHDDFVASELVLPVDREVDVRIRAHDVIHGFFIPGMRIKQNALPGQTLHVHFTPMQTGVYPILCSQLCGMGHYRMQANLHVVTQDEYERWLEIHETHE